MVVNRRRKVVKYRGHNTHGGGISKKRRGAGSRGGRGRAGTGKRAGQKKAGLKGFKLGKEKGFIRRRNIRKEVGINLGCFTPKMITNCLNSGKAIQEGNFYVIDLSKLGYDKLLGGGSTTLKLKILVNKFSAQAEEKIKAAGGEIVGRKAKINEKEEE